MFKKSDRNWVDFRQLSGVLEVDYHLAGGLSCGAYWENMKFVKDSALAALMKAQEEGYKYVLFRHGHSTSHRGATTSRSQVRSVMRSKEATPYIIRKECIQHYSVFVAAIRPKPEKPTP